MRKKSLFPYFGIFLLAAFALQACSPYYFRSNYQDANKLLYDTKSPHTKPFLKAHLRNGDVCILRNSWQVDTSQKLVSGSGMRFDFNRKKTFDGPMQIPLDSVAIFETNKKIIDPEMGRITALSILAGVDVAVGIFCAYNPKACYGSCPTFYLNPNDNFHYADAEGFSNAIVPAMEYADIDALHNK